MNFDDLLKGFDFDEDQDDVDGPSMLDINIIKSNISSYDDKRLCEMIVCVRYFGLDQNIGTLCMQELARRRELGDNFDFETYIESSYQELPVFTFGGTDLRSILGQMISPKGNK